MPAACISSRIREPGSKAVLVKRVSALDGGSVAAIVLGVIVIIALAGAVSLSYYLGRQAENEPSSSLRIKQPTDSKGEGEGEFSNYPGKNATAGLKRIPPPTIRMSSIGKPESIQGTIVFGEFDDDPNKPLPPVPPVRNLLPEREGDLKRDLRPETTSISQPRESTESRPDVPFSAIFRDSDAVFMLDSRYSEASFPQSAVRGSFSDFRESVIDRRSKEYRSRLLNAIRAEEYRTKIPTSPLVTAGGMSVGSGALSQARRDLRQKQESRRDTRMASIDNNMGLRSSFRTSRTTTSNPRSTTFSEDRDRYGLPPRRSSESNRTRSSQYSTSEYEGEIVRVPEKTAALPPRYTRTESLGLRF